MKAITVCARSYVFCYRMCSSWQNLHVCPPEQSVWPPSSWKSSYHLRDSSRYSLVVAVSACYNGVSIIPPPTYSANVLFTDACITCAGGHFQEQCFHVAFPNYILVDDDYNINIKELLAIIVALRLWGRQLTGRRLLIHSDNQNAVLAITNK